MKTKLFLSACLIMCLAACGTGGSAPGMTLAIFDENRVTVELSLEFDENDQAWLVGQFTPEEGYHLYGMSLPDGGVDGVGRPTRLELVAGSRLTQVGLVSESVTASPEADGPADLVVYPPGPVTLRMAVVLPAGSGWFDEQVSVSYMACHTGTCCPPVVGRLVAVSVPGQEEGR